MVVNMASMRGPSEEWLPVVILWFSSCSPQDLPKPVFQPKIAARPCTSVF